MNRVLTFIDQWRFSSLLGMLLAAIFLQPILQSVTGGVSFLIVFFAVIFAAAIRATRPVAMVSGFGLGITVLWAGVSLFTLAYESAWLKGLAVVVTLLLAALVVWRTLEALVLENKADRDALAGAIFGYFLLAVLWSEVYRAMELYQPGTFALSGNAAVGTEMLYLSLVTITTLGYGDVLPLAPFSRILAGIEAAFGTLYIAILIGRIVGAIKPSAHRTNAADKAAGAAED